MAITAYEKFPRALIAKRINELLKWETKLYEFILQSFASLAEKH